jgi:hypothetical protein
LSRFAVTLGAPPPDVDAFAAGAIGRSFAADPAFRAAFERHGPGWRWWTATLRDDAGTLVAALPGAVERRFGGAWLRLAPYGAPAGPLLAPGLDAEGRRAAAAALWAGLDDHVRRRGMLGGDLTFTRPAADDAALRPRAGLGVERSDDAHVIDAGAGYEAWHASLRKRARQQLTKAERLGVTAGVDCSAGALDAVHALHLEQMRRWGGRDVRPAAFYRALLDAPGDAARLWVARADGAVLCGVLVLLGGEDAYVWWSGSGLEARKRLAFPYLLSRVVAECGRGIVNLGFSGRQDRLTDFKEQMGAQPVAVPILELTPRPRTPYHALLAAGRAAARDWRARRAAAAAAAAAAAVAPAPADAPGEGEAAAGAPA